MEEMYEAYYKIMAHKMELKVLLQSPIHRQASSPTTHMWISPRAPDLQIHHSLFWAVASFEVIFYELLE